MPVGRAALVLLREDGERRPVVTSGLIMAAFAIVPLLVLLDLGDVIDVGLPHGPLDLSAVIIFGGWSLFFVVLIAVGTPGAAEIWRGQRQLAVDEHALYVRRDSVVGPLVSVPWTSVAGLGVRVLDHDDVHVPSAEAVRVLDHLEELQDAVGEVALLVPPGTYRQRVMGAAFRSAADEIAEVPLLLPAGAPCSAEDRIVPARPGYLLVTVALRPHAEAPRAAVRRALDIIEAHRDDLAASACDAAAAALCADLSRWSRTWSAHTHPVGYHLVVAPGRLDPELVGRAVAAVRPEIVVAPSGHLPPGALDTPHALATLAADLVTQLFERIREAGGSAG